MTTYTLKDFERDAEKLAALSSCDDLQGGIAPLQRAQKTNKTPGPTGVMKRHQIGLLEHTFVAAYAARCVTITPMCDLLEEMAE